MHVGVMGSNQQGLMACVATFQSTITVGNCDTVTTSRIECQNYLRYVYNYVQKTVAFNCSRVKDSNGNFVQPPQCACYYTLTSVTTPTVSFNDCVQRNFPYCDVKIVRFKNKLSLL
jgi:hypothetical protein